MRTDTTKVMFEIDGINVLVLICTVDHIIDQVK